MVGWVLNRLLDDARGRRERGLVGFADAQEGEGELGVGGDALEQSVAQLEELLPVGDDAVEVIHAALDDGVAEHAEAEAEGEGLDEHIGGDEKGGAKEGNN